MKNLTYTRTGDEGKTSLIGGLRVAKYDDRVEAYGTVDELSAFIGVLQDQDGVAAEQKAVFETVQNKLDVMNEQLPELRSFVIPGGNLKASHAHVCRTVCRRAERQGWRLAAQHPVDSLDLKYLNRLSDYFFVLARFFTFLDKVDENSWESTK